jgi:Tetratricopeptide repeat
MALADDLVALASLAGNTLVAAAVTDAWEVACRGVARLLGRGDPSKTQLAEQRLDDTRQQLAEPKGEELEQARVAHAERWAGRLADLLEEDPAAVADLRALVQEIQAALPVGIVAVAGDAVAAGHDVNISASGGGVAAGVIHGNVLPPSPTGPGPGQQLGGPGVRVAAHQGVAATSGGIAAGHVETLNLAVEYHRPRAAGHPVRLPPRLVLFAGREELLAALDARLSAGDGPWPRIVYLCGLGGTGKSSVAVEYAHRHRTEAGMAWQFAAADANVLAAGFGELAAQLGVRDLSDIRDPVASVHGVLAGYEAGWILIFDNAAELASVAEFLPPAGPGQVLITSQSSLWPPTQAIEVAALDTEVAAEFLINRTSDPDRQAAAGLAVELGGLPLALEQAAAYIQAAGDSLAGYLAAFRQRRPAMLSRGEPTGYDKTVATTWALATDQLEQISPGSVGLLRLLAWCAPEAVPLRLLLQPRPGLAGELSPQVAAVLMPLLEDSLAAGDAIVALRRYSLVSPLAGGLVSVHRLVQAVTADQMPAKLAEAWRQAAATVIGAAIPEDPGQPDSWPDFAALLPHAQTALSPGSDGIQQIAAYLGSSGSYAAARNLCEEVLDARIRVLGPEHPDTLTTQDELAAWTGYAGNPAGARDQFAALLPLREQVLGPEHPDTLDTRGSLARWTGYAGNPAGARDHFTVLLPIHERVLGRQHADTLVTHGAQARWTGEAGDAAQARDQFAALLPAYEQAFDPDHPSTLNARKNLAFWTGCAGNPALARDQFAALAPVFERLFGPEHPDTLVIRAHLARWTGEGGDPATARDQFAALVPVSERILGKDHPDSLAARASLAHWIKEAASDLSPGAN